jgi:hypothetical protein
VDLGTSSCAAAKCRLWVRTGHFAEPSPCPLYPRKRTFAHAIMMSALVDMPLLLMFVCLRGNFGPS